METAIGANLPSVLVDPHQFELALLNLVLNARDAMPQGGRVTIAAHKDTGANQVAGLPGGEFVCILVADSGSGMDEQVLKRATEPFFTTKGVGKGTGLGLPMVHGLAAQSGGTMQIESKVGHGTSVRLWLPVDTTGEVAETRLPEVEARATASHRVLVVDDDSLILSSAAAMLEDLGHVVIVASSGTAALEILRANAKVDVVVTDYAMPHMNGLELADLLHQQWPWLPVILASGYAEFANAGTIFSLERLAKPYNQAEIAACIERVLEERKIIPLNAARSA
jgi:CheY-like chemotaxis protein